MFPSKVISNLAKTFSSQLSLNPSFVLAISCNRGFQTSSVDHSSKHGGMYTKDYNILKERPLGPHKKLPPGVKHDGRVGELANYRYKVHYPEDGKYTIRKLPLTKLGGRDPVTGRKIIGRVGGGSKQKYRWIQWQRLPDDWPRDGPPLVERVISINYDPVRKPMIALTGYEDKLRWQIATAGMKEGDLITTSFEIPDIPVKPVQGNSYPIGALPVGTSICLLQKYPDGANDEFDLLFFKENSSGTILRKVGDRVVVEDERRHHFAFDKTCQCVVGKVSIHPLKALPIGCPQRLRWLGHRPRSGLWHRKTGTAGRKVRALPPLEIVERKEPVKDKTIVLTCETEGTKGRIGQKNKPWLIEKW